MLAGGQCLDFVLECCFLLWHGSEFTNDATLSQTREPAQSQANEEARLNMATFCLKDLARTDQEKEKHLYM